MPRNGFMATAITIAVAMAMVTAAPAHADDVQLSKTEFIAPGVTYQAFTADTVDGTYQGHLIRADLWNPLVGAGLIHPGAVAATAPVSQMADDRKAVAAVNGDFFNIGETGAPVGPAIADGEPLKAAVPDRQRHGPDMPPGYTNDDGFGITWDGRAVLTDLRVDGKIVSDAGTWRLDALNQYAITVDGIGAFNHHWGSADRTRATCGTDDDRNGPCSRETLEVHVTGGVVTQISPDPGDGVIDENTVVLVGRDGGAAQLAALAEGDLVSVGQTLSEENGARLQTAIGGFPIVDESEVAEGIDEVAAAPRTAVGATVGGRVLYMVAVEGRNETGDGISLATLAKVMVELGCDIAVNLDGGGSTTLATRTPGSASVTVRNALSDGGERLVPNGLAVYGLRV